MSERLREARADGHLENNPALFDLLEEQIQLERRIATLEARLAAVRIAEPNGDGLWDDYSGGAEKKSDRHLIGTAVLVILLGLALVATTRAVPGRERRLG